MNHFLKSVITTAALVVATAASATSVTVDDYTFSAGKSPVKFTLTVNVTAPDLSITTTTYGGPGAPGVYAGEVQTATVGGSSFAAYCYDLTKELSLPGAYEMSTTQLDSVARLFAVAGFSGDNWAADGVNGLQTAALQVALWESKYDGLVNATPAADGSTVFDSGNLTFQAMSSSVKTQALSYLSAAAGLATGSYYSNVRYFTPSEGTVNQALVTTVPEPSTYALMAACLGVVGLVARRKSV